MLLSLLVACGVTVRPTCVETRTEVGDDEVTDAGFSAADLLAIVVGDHTGDGVWDDGAAAIVNVIVARGVGEAAFVHQEPATIETPNGELFGRDSLLVGVVCEDRVEVPSILAVETADGRIDLQTASASALAETLEDAEVRLRVDADAMDGVPPATREASFGYAEVSFGSGIMTGGVVGWEGETGSGGWFERALLWGDLVD